MASELAASRGLVLASVARRLAEGGVADARREALRIWSDLVGTHGAEAVTHPSAAIDAALADRLLEAAARRARGEPLAYATGRTGFRQLVLRSDRRALIPRPETEGLVDLLLGRVRTGHAADIGTGTGALALSLAQEGEFGAVVGVDVSAPALELAAENRRETGLAVSLVRGDLCAAFGASSLDALVCNPPYLTEAEYAGLDASVRAWEPALALVSGPDGLRATRRLLEEGRRVVRTGGWIALELDCTRADASARLAAAGGWEQVAIHADLFGRERYLLARRSATP